MKAYDYLKNLQQHKATHLVKYLGGRWSDFDLLR